MLLLQKIIVVSQSSFVNVIAIMCRQKYSVIYLKLFHKNPRANNMIQKLDEDLYYILPRNIVWGPSVIFKLGMINEWNIALQIDSITIL